MKRFFLFRKIVFFVSSFVFVLESFAIFFVDENNNTTFDMQITSIFRKSRFKFSFEQNQFRQQSFKHRDFAIFYAFFLRDSRQSFRNSQSSIRFENTLFIDSRVENDQRDERNQRDDRNQRDEQNQRDENRENRENSYKSFQKTIRLR